MSDMFYNYDHSLSGYDILKSEESPLANVIILEQTSDTCLVKNIHNDVIGVQARLGSQFPLYFNLEGKINNIDISKLLKDCSATFEIFDGRDCVLLSEDIPATNITSDYIEVDIDTTDDIFTSDIFKMRLSLIYASGATPYILFDKDDGFLYIC